MQIIVILSLPQKTAKAKSFIFLKYPLLFQKKKV